MRVTAVVVSVTALLVLAYGTWTAFPVASQPPTAAHARLSLRCGSHHGLRSFAVFKGYVCTVEVSEPDGDIPRLVLDFGDLDRWAMLGDLTGKLGWNEADADYGPQRVSGHPMSVDFGVAAKEIHFMFRPTKTGRHSATIRAYIGTWRNGHPWIVSRLRGAQLTGHLIIH